MWLSHAMHTTGTLDQGLGKIRKKEVYSELNPEDTIQRVSSSFLLPSFKGARWLNNTTEVYFSLDATIEIIIKKFASIERLKWISCVIKKLVNKKHKDL